MTTPVSDKAIFSLKKHSYEVSVKVDDEAVPIYEVQYFPEERKLLGWIASEVGQEYSVFMKQNTSFKYTTAADLLIDGRQVCDTVFGKDYGFQDELSGIAVSSTTSRPFSFRQLETTDDPLVLGKNHGFDTPGLIEVRMNRVRIVETGRENNWEDYFTEAPERELLVHESEHKAGTHVMQLGEEKPSDNVRIFTLPLEPSDEEPWVTFEFHYRPAAVLQAEGIIHPLPSEPPTTLKGGRGNRTLNHRNSPVGGPLRQLRGVSQASGLGNYRDSPVGGPLRQLRGVSQASGLGNYRDSPVGGSQRSVRGVSQASRAKPARQTRSPTHSSPGELDAEVEASRKVKLLVIEAMQASLDDRIAEYRNDYGNIGLPLRYAITE